MLRLMDRELADYARAHGCLERKTWKLLDATSRGAPVQSATYMNEALWPGQQEADAFSRAEPAGDVKQALDELFGGIEIVTTARYVDQGG